MKKLMLFVGIFFCSGMLSQGQEIPGNQLGEKGKPGPRIDQVRDNGHEVVRFYDKTGRKTRELQLGQKETRAVLKKGRSFNSADFGLKISTSVAEQLEAGRRRSGRDMLVKRRVSKDAAVTRNGKYIVVHDSRGDYLGYADGRDVENWDYPEAVETEDSETVCDLEGNEIVKFSETEGGVAEISNSGQFIVVFISDSVERILNPQKEVLIEIPFVARHIYFSGTDKYIIFVEGGGAGSATISVYDTENKKLELRKLVVNGSLFQGIDEIEISEVNREIIVQHIWDPKKAEKKLEKIKF